MIKNHKVERKERLMVKLRLDFPDPHNNKSYQDERRHFTVKVDNGETEKITEESTLNLNIKLRSLVVIKKMFGNKIDSSLTYRVGENFGLLRINVTTLRIAFSFSEANAIKVLDNTSHILESRILERTTYRQDESGS